MRGGGEGRGWGWRSLDGRDDVLNAVADVLVDVAEDLLLLGQVLALELGHDSAAANVGEVSEPQLPVLERVLRAGEDGRSVVGGRVVTLG